MTRCFQLVLFPIVVLLTAWRKLTGQITPNPPGLDDDYGLTEAAIRKQIRDNLATYRHIVGFQYDRLHTGMGGASPRSWPQPGYEQPVFNIDGERVDRSDDTGDGRTTTARSVSGGVGPPIYSPDDLKRQIEDQPDRTQPWWPKPTPPRPPTPTPAPTTTRSSRP